MGAELHVPALGSGDGTIHRSASPFVHKFRTDNHKYVFDVNTGEILRVDDVVWEIVEDSCRRKGDVVAKYRSQFGTDRILAAYSEIEKARAEGGVFLNYRPEIRMGLSREQVDDMVERRRKMLLLEVTENCNFQCTYCGRNLPDSGCTYHGTRNMAWETARAAIDEFLQHCRAFIPTADCGISSELTSVYPTEAAKKIEQSDTAAHIGFYGGEPLLNFPLIRKCTEYALDKAKGKVDFGIATNGYLLKGHIAEFLGAHNFLVRVSLDGPPGIHDKHRRTVDDSPTCAVVQENLRAFLTKYRRRLSIVGATVGRGTDVREVHKHFATAAWLPPTTLILITLASDPYPGYYEPVSGVEKFPGLDALYAQYRENLVRGRMGLGLMNKDLLLQGMAFDGYFSRLHRKRWTCAEARRHLKACSPGGACVAGVSRTFVTAIGEYYPCERVPQCEACRIGDVTTGIDKEKAYAMLKEFVECTRAECQSCWCLPICSVGCHASVRDKNNGFTKAAKIRACERVRESQHNRLVDYCCVLEKNAHAFDYLS